MDLQVGDIFALPPLPVLDPRAQYSAPWLWQAESEETAQEAMRMRKHATQREREREREREGQRE